MTEYNERIILSFLSEFQGGLEPDCNDYGISEEEYYQIIKQVENAGFIANINWKKYNSWAYSKADLQKAFVTEKGKEYLRQNSAIMKLYKGAKEFMYWVKL